MRRTAGTSSPGGGGVFGREKRFGNSRCEVLCQFAGAVSVQAAVTGTRAGCLRNNGSLSLLVLEAEKVQGQGAERFSVWGGSDSCVLKWWKGEGVMWFLLSGHKSHVS